MLNDLEICGFITRYSPFNLTNKSLLARYSITDNYLQFYFKFIKPLAQKIDEGSFNKQPMSAINLDILQKWLGFAFERFCRRYHFVLAHILGFGAIQYKSGSFFSRNSESDTPGYQIDLVFDRADHVYSVCEIKYSSTPVTSKVIDDFEKKLQLFPRKSSSSLQKVLITIAGADQALIDRHYFDRIISIDDLFDIKWW